MMVMMMMMMMTMMVVVMMVVKKKAQLENKLLTFFMPVSKFGTVNDTACAKQLSHLPTYLLTDFVFACVFAIGLISNCATY